MRTRVAAETIARTRIGGATARGMSLCEIRPAVVIVVEMMTTMTGGIGVRGRASEGGREKTMGTGGNGLDHGRQDYLLAAKLEASCD